MKKKHVLKGKLNGNPKFSKFMRGGEAGGGGGRGVKLALFGLNGHVAGESSCTKSALSFF